MEIIPYSRQSISDDDVAAVEMVLRSPFLTQGPVVPEFEKAVASLHHVSHAVAVCNATAALHIACLALDVGPGDNVWTVPNSFVASANCARYCGAVVNFVDIDPSSRNISVQALRTKLDFARSAGNLPKVLISVDFSGLPCDMDEIMVLAKEYDFRVISDSSHAVGAEYQGAPIGKHADVTVLSFHPVKIVTTGEGGMCLTNDAKIAGKLALLRSHGITRDPNLMGRESSGGWYYEQVSLGFNYRMPDINAALGLSQLRRLPAQFARRDTLARRYDDLLCALPLKLPKRPNDRASSHHLYVVELQDECQVSRADVFASLREHGIGVNVHYIPIHLQPHYQALGFAKGDFPASEAYYDRAITIPLFPDLTDAEQDRVCDTLAEIIK